MRAYGWVLAGLALAGCSGGGDDSASKKRPPLGDDSAPVEPACLGTGFGAAVSDWSLPSGFQAGALDSLYDTSSSDGVVWGLLDLTGDGGADLVVADNDAGAGGIGSTKWLVYENSGTGFGPSAADWSLPSGFQDGALDTLYDTSSSDGAEWGLLDLTGDGAVDLVVSDTDAGSGGIGSTKWLVYENSGTGFGPSATDWSLPSGFQNGALDSLSDTSSSDGAVWGLLDLTGDGAVDLVVADTDAGSGGIGSTKWLVYENSGTGFGPSAADWSLPSGFQDGALDTLSDSSSSDGAVWGLLDLTGDGAVDLVVSDTDAGTGGIGSTKWLVYENSSAGFGPSATDWSLPSGFQDGALDTLADSSSSDGAVWGLLDLDGDAATDLVVADTDAGAGGVGSSKWLLYANSGSGFGPTASDWSLPVGFTDGAFDTLYDSSSSDGADWTLLNLGQDNVLDVVIAKNDVDGSVGASHWQVIDAVCE